MGRLSGRARHGHGLRLVRRTAARHGGSFALHLGEQGTSAVLELPLAPLRRVEPRQEIVISREATRPARAEGPDGAEEFRRGNS